MRRLAVAALLAAATLTSCRPADNPACAARMAMEDVLHFVTLNVEVIDPHGVPVTTPVDQTTQFVTADGVDAVFCDDKGEAGAGPKVDPMIAPYQVRIQWYEPVLGAAMRIDAHAVPPGYSLECSTVGEDGTPGDFQVDLALDVPGTYDLTVTCATKGLPGR